MNKNFILKSLLTLILTLIISWAYFFLPKPLLTFDNKLRDFMFNVRGKLPKSDSVVIVDIDEKSLKKLGQWPWSRNIFADLIYKVTDAGARIIGLDIVFAEEDRTSPHKLQSKIINKSKKLANYDEILAKCFASTPVVGGYTFTFDEKKETNVPMIPAVFISRGIIDGDIHTFNSVVLNIPILQNSLYSSGFFNNNPDFGGMIRRVPLIIKYDNTIYPSLALEMVRIYSNSNKVQIISSPNGVERIEFGEYKIPTDNQGQLIINFRGPKKHFKYISIADIMDGSFNKNDIKDKFVIIGTSSMGLVDTRAMVFDRSINGVEIHANVIDNILSGDFLKIPTDKKEYDLTMIWLIIIISMIIFSIVKSWIVIPIAIILIYIIFQIFFVLLFEYGVVLNLLFPLISFILTLVLSVSIDYILASKQKEEAKRMLGKKVSPAVMEYLLEHSAEELIISKEVEATIFFSDIRSFTSISEKIGSPGRLIQMLNRYMTPMVDCIIDYKGTIDKFIGDAIMAYWNAPIEIPNHADKALKSAVAQIEMLVDINKEITPEYDVTINIGIGLHTGRVTAGDMGSYGRSDYTIIGDNVNLASRLEGLTKQYGGQILISSATKSKLKESYKIRPIDLVEVKGKNKAVEIFEVLCKNKDISNNEIEIYTKAIEYFRDAHIKTAYNIFIQLEEDNPSILYKFYIKRCKQFLDNSSLKFTPILKMTTK